MPNPFPPCVQDKIFKTKCGDVCLCLHEAWPSLLADLGLLGPVFLVTRNGQMALASLVQQLDFVAVPGGTEMLDLNSGLCLDTAGLGSVTAGLDGQAETLDLHFYDKDGFGFFKVVLAPGADLDGFVRLMAHYGKHRNSFRSCQVASLAPEMGAVLASELADLREAWFSYNPSCGGDFLPDGRVSWLDALRLAGRERSHFLSKVGLTKIILAGRRDGLPLRVTAWWAGLHQEITLTPRSLERCGQCLHLLDAESEAHFFFGSDFEAWVGLHGKKRQPAVHIFSNDGRRCGIIQPADEAGENEAWRQTVLAAAGLVRQDD